MSPDCTEVLRGLGIANPAGSGGGVRNVRISVQGVSGLWLQVICT